MWSLERLLVNAGSLGTAEERYLSDTDDFRVYSTCESVCSLIRPTAYMKSIWSIARITDDVPFHLQVQAYLPDDDQMMRQYPAEANRRFS